MNYEKKYLKYKQKYLNYLAKGGGPDLTQPPLNVRLKCTTMRDGSKPVFTIHYNNSKNGYFIESIFIPNSSRGWKCNDIYEQKFLN
jgi:hypothetical protein